ncbi:MAG TPA: SMP-30/gluconolactonase/LRE family protein, partial [Rhizomicrobium sp.]|nr:SMP-30/gluconolactonase/LRE family protein [Rhizomicrobium sp.]
QGAKPQLAPLSSILNGRTYGHDAPPNIYPDPDILILDPAANDCFIGHSSIKRVKTGFEWAEGPAWSEQGQYVVFSDVSKDIQYRYIWETGQITEFRRQSFNSNGNTFDFQGRQITAQHFLRRVIRWEHDGSMTVIADNYNGQPLNSPNDIAPHKDGSIWFTDPYYGAQLAEGHPDPGVAIFNPKGLANPNIGNGSAGIIGSQKQVRPPCVYRWDPSGRLDVMVEGKPGLVPNGIAFSPDYSKVYFVWGTGIDVADVVGNRIANQRRFTDCNVDGVHCGPDGHRVDVAGNVWSGSTSELGYMGVTVWNPAGKCIGRIRLPETCANVTFCGPKRDWLWMCASQSVYLVRLGIQGAAPG